MENEKPHNADLTNNEDLSFAVMNLVSIEEHLAMTSVKAGRAEYLHILAAVRKLRIKLLKRLVIEPEGEVWCISKHLLAASMRMMETATKYLGVDDSAALELERGAFDLYSLFWLLQALPKKEGGGTTPKKGQDSGSKKKQAAEATT